MRKLLILSVLIVGGAHALAPDPPREIIFAGHSWIVRDGTGGPGPNHFSADHVRVDPAGNLHLLLAPCDKGWCAAEVKTKERFLYGDFRFEVATTAPTWDPRGVLGLFTYGPPEAGPDGTNEIDVEIAQFGDPDASRGHFTVWPSTPGPLRTHRFDLPTPGLALDAGFTWAPGRVDFRLADATGVGAPLAWTHEAPTVPAASARVHLNLWLFQGVPPQLGVPVEVVVRAVDLPS